MAYVIDRQRALHSEDIVVVVRSQQPRVNSRIVLGDNSWYHTLSRPRTILHGGWDRWLQRLTTGTP